jgi:hypothetical protein
MRKVIMVAAGLGLLAVTAGRVRAERLAGRREVHAAAPASTAATRLAAEPASRASDQLTGQAAPASPARDQGATPALQAPPAPAVPAVTIHSTPSAAATNPPDPPAQAQAPAPSHPAPVDPNRQPPATAEGKPSPSIRISYDQGLRFTTEDGRFSLRIAGGLQFRYTFVAYDHAVSGNDTDYSNFYLRRARIWFDGQVYDPRLTYYVHLQLEPASAVNVHDAWINYAVRPLFQVGLGRNKIAYGLEMMYTGFGNDMIDRSIFSGESDISTGSLSKWPGGGTQNFTVSASEQPNTGFPVGALNLYRSQGVQVGGRNGDKGRVFEYQVGLWNGRDTRGLSNVETGHLVSARAGFYPSGWINWAFAGDAANTQRVRVGFLASAYNDRGPHTLNAAGQAVPRYNSSDSGVDLAGMVRYRGFSTDVEWERETYDITDASAPARDFDRQGWRIQTGYFVKPGVFEVVGRYAAVQRLMNPTVDKVRASGLGFAKVLNSSGVFQDAAERQLGELTFGVCWYLLRGVHQHKIMADYSRLARDFAGFVSGASLAGSPPEQQDERVRAMVQVRF